MEPQSSPSHVTPMCNPDSGEEAEPDDFDTLGHCDLCFGNGAADLGTSAAFGLRAAGAGPPRTSSLVTAAVDTAAAVAENVRPEPAAEASGQQMHYTRSPLTPRAAPQPTATPFATPRSLEAAKKPIAVDSRDAWGEELSTRPPSSAGVQLSRRANGKSPQQGNRHLRSPPKPSTPRQRMSDYFHDPASPIRYPEVLKQQRSPNTAGRGAGARFTTPLLSPRNLAGDNYPRAGLSTSNDCVEWLRECQSNTRVEDLVDEMLSAQQDVNHTEEYRFARSNLRNASYRDATRCATSMARRTKPPQAWR